MTEFVKKIDFTNIQNTLDENIKKKNLSISGLCPQRHELYKDCFDEIILKLTNVDPEKGVILSRIRDELNMTSESYKKLYESSVSFGLDKAISARQQNEKLHARIDEVIREKLILVRENEYLKRKLKAIEDGEETKREEEICRYKSELRKLKNRNEQIKRGLENVLLNSSEQVSNILLDLIHIFHSSVSNNQLKHIFITTEHQNFFNSHTTSTKHHCMTFWLPQCEDDSPPASLCIIQSPVQSKVMNDCSLPCRNTP